MKAAARTNRVHVLLNPAKESKPKARKPLPRTPGGVHNVDHSDAIEQTVTTTSNVNATSEDLDRMNEDEIRTLSGRRLHSARATRGLYLRQVIEMMRDVWPDTQGPARLQHYEQGNRSIPVSAARALGKRLGVSAAWLLCVDDTVGLDAEALSFIVQFRAARADVRKMIADLLSITPAR